MLSGVSRRTGSPPLATDTREQELQMMRTARSSCPRKREVGTGLVWSIAIADALDPVDAWLVHAIEELPRVGGTCASRRCPRHTGCRTPATTCPSRRRPVQRGSVEQKFSVQVLEIVLACTRMTIASAVASPRAATARPNHGRWPHHRKRRAQAFCRPWSKASLVQVEPEGSEHLPRDRRRHVIRQGVGGSGCTRRRGGLQYGCRKTSPRHTGTAASAD